MKTLTQSLKTIALALVLALGVSYVSAWTAPTDVPTDGNVASPLNTSANTQYKAGTLGAELFRSYGNLIVDGNVGIGVTEPGQKLEVDGTIKSSGDVCTDQAGGKCLSSVASLLNNYIEEYSNVGEDIYTNTTLQGPDTCNGDTLNSYTCSLSDNKSCKDTYGYACGYGGCVGSTRNISCKAQKMLKKYDGLSECSGTGKIFTIPDGEINDGGGSAQGDALEVYCFSGVARWCLSGESCPWRGASSDTTGGKTCSRSGLGSDWMATAYGNKWMDNFLKEYTNYYCNSSEQKYGN